MTTQDTRPRPIKTAATTVTTVIGTLGALVTALVGFGVLTAVQGDAIVGLLGAIPGLVTLATTALGAFGVVRRAEPHTTPLSDPRAEDGTPLAPWGGA